MTYYSGRGDVGSNPCHCQESRSSYRSNAAIVLLARPILSNHGTQQSSAYSQPVNTSESSIRLPEDTRIVGGDRARSFSEIDAAHIRPGSVPRTDPVHLLTTETTLKLVRGDPASEDGASMRTLPVSVEAWVSLYERRDHVQPSEQERKNFIWGFEVLGAELDERDTIRGKKACQDIEETLSQRDLN